MPILLTGATGFVGSALLDHLEGEPVRAFVRDAARLDAGAGVDVVEGDLDDAAAVREALDGCDVAYYLVHSMEKGQGDYAERDRELAQTFADACDHAGCRRIVYLGGVVPPDGEGSEHLDSRKEVEDVLDSAGAELVVLRASMIVGAGSASFSTLAQIVDRMPVLALPTWRDTCTQPVGIDDVVAALAAARDDAIAPGRYAIAGPDRLSVESMIDVIGELLGSRSPKLRVPASWAKVEATVAAGVADADVELLEPLLEGLHENLTVDDNALEPVFGVRPTPFREAAERAVRELGD